VPSTPIESRVWSIERRFNAPVRGGGPSRIIAMAFDAEKLKMVWLPDAEKI